MCQRAEGGHSIGDLITDLGGRAVSPTELIKVDRLVAAALGSDWRGINEMRFDYERAKDSLRFYWSKEIPTVDANLPLGVSHVEFAADLSGCQEIRISDLHSNGRLFSACVPQ